MKKKLAVLTALTGSAAALLAAYRRGRRPEAFGVRYREAATRVVVVGGGFGGMAAVDGLAEALGGARDVGVVVLDKANYTTFYPMVPSAISGNIEVRHAAHSIRRCVSSPGAEFVQAEVSGVDFEKREVHSDAGVFPYDYLVLAPGSVTAFFGTPGAREHAIDLKGLPEALTVRNTIIDRFEEADRLRGEPPEGLLTFVFVGGGPTGVEAVADSHDLIFGVLEDDYPDIDFDRVRLVLVNSANHILKGMDPSLAHAAMRRLAAQRVEILDNVKAQEVRSDAVLLSDGRAVPARTTVWAAGVEPADMVKELDVPGDSRGRILVDEFLRVRNRPGVYAVGDCVRLEIDGEPVPALAQAAEQEGRVAARNVAAEIRGDDLTPFRYRHLGQLVDLGTTSALTDILGIRLSGYLGALIWKAVYLYELGTNLNRVQVIADWTIDLFARPDTAKLFEDREPGAGSSRERTA